MAGKTSPGRTAKGVVRKLQRERTNAIVSIFQSGDYSDLVIANKDVQYKVHRAIVLPQSAVLSILLERRPEETQPAVINLMREEDPATVRHMVTYFYRLDYDDLSEDKAAGHECVQHAKLYAIADRYKIHGLKKLALARFQDAAGTGLWDKASLLAVAREAYDWTLTSGRALQDAVVQVFCRHKGALCQEGWKTDLERMGALLYDMLVWENSREPGALKKVEPEAPREAEPEAITKTEPEAPPVAEPEALPEAEPETPPEAVPPVDELEVSEKADPWDYPAPEPRTPVEDEPEAPVEDEPAVPVEDEPEAYWATEPEAHWATEPEAPVEDIPEAPEDEPEVVEAVLEDVQQSPQSWNGWPEALPAAEPEDYAAAELATDTVEDPTPKLSKKELWKRKKAERAARARMAAASTNSSPQPIGVSW